MEELEIDLGKLLKIFHREIYLLLLGTIMGVFVVLTGTFFLVEPQYQSTVTLYVERTNSGKSLEDSFSFIVQMRESLLEVIKYTKTDRNHTQLQEMISVTAVDNTDFVQLTVTSPDPYEAEYLANSIGVVLPEQVAKVMTGTSAKVVDEAIPASRPSFPSYPNSAFLGGTIGLMLSAGYVLVREFFLKKEQIRSP